MLSHILITNDLDIAEHAFDCGVDYIMIDFELLGKKDRQKNFNMLQSYHTIDDLDKFRKKFPSQKLIVRCNSPKYANVEEIKPLLEYCPQILMVPYFDTVEELNPYFKEASGSSTKVMPLFETASSFFKLREFFDYLPIELFYIGLNDLRISIGYDFLFEALSNNLIDYANMVINSCPLSRQLKFGFGGVSRIGTGELPAELILSEHIRCNSDFVILSRAFHENSLTFNELIKKIDLAKEIRCLREKELIFRKSNSDTLLKNHELLKQYINKVKSKNNEKKSS